MTNYGSDPDWRDIDKFAARGLQLIREHYDLRDAPVLGAATPTKEFIWAKWQSWAWLGFAVVIGYVILR